MAPKFVRTTVTIPADLKARMAAFAGRANWSAVAAGAFAAAIRALEARGDGPTHDVLPGTPREAAAWLELLAAEMGQSYQRCPGCGRWFEFGPGINKATRQTCSDACRQRLHRRRSEARALEAMGVTADEIASRLGVDAGTVGGWLSGLAG